MVEDVRDVAARELLPVATGREVWREVSRLLRGRRLAVAGVCALFLVEAAAALVFPFVVGGFVDEIGGGGAAGATPGFWWRVGLLVVAVLGTGVVAWCAAIAMAHIAETLVAELREAFVDAALALPRATVERAGIGDVVTRASDDITQISDSLPEVVPKLFVALFTLVLVGGGLAALDPRFLLVYLVIVPIHLLAVRWYLRVAPVVYGRERESASALGAAVLGTLTQLPTVAAHRLGARRLERVRSTHWSVALWSLRARIVQNGLFGRLNIAEGLGLVSVLALGVVLAITEGLSAGAVTAAALLFLRTVVPISTLLFVMDEFQTGYAALARVVGILGVDPGARGHSDDEQVDSSPSSAGSVADGGDDASGEGDDGVRDDGGAAHGEGVRGDDDGRGDGDDAERGDDGSASDDGAARDDGRDEHLLIHARDVRFAYHPGAPVLHGVDLRLHRDERIAVVGASGSGKSTLASLVADVHEPEAGIVERFVPVERIATVTQETHVFAGTVRENLTLARPDAADEELRSALATVGLDGVVALLPAGLDAPLGADGHALTAAQTQQLALARVMLLDPEVVVLDEATADAGAADAGVLEVAVRAVLPGRAALFIAHRLTQARDADRVLVLDRGLVVEEGTHDDLVARGAAYARMWAAWTRGRGDDGTDGEANGARRPSD